MVKLQRNIVPPTQIAPPADLFEAADGLLVTRNIVNIFKEAFLVDTTTVTQPGFDIAGAAEVVIKRRVYISVLLAIIAPFEPVVLLIP